MDISVVVRKKDLVVLNFYMFPRLRGNWFFFALLSAGILAYILIVKKPSNAQDIGIATFAALVGALGGSIATMLIGLLTMLLTLGKNSGVLGAHHYSLSELGLGERTDANESLQKWCGIQSIIRLPKYLLFRVNSYLLYVVPRRAFATTEEFNLFYERAVELKRAV